MPQETVSIKPSTVQRFFNYHDSLPFRGRALIDTAAIFLAGLLIAGGVKAGDAITGNGSPETCAELVNEAIATTAGKLTLELMNMDPDRFATGWLGQEIADARTQNPHGKVFICANNEHGRYSVFTNEIPQDEQFTMFYSETNGPLEAS